MSWLNPEDMRKHKNEFQLYIVRRKDTGQFYKNIKSSHLKNWEPDDPRRLSWTDDIELATTYVKSGIKQALSVGKRSAASGYERDEAGDLVLVKINPPPEVEMVTLNVRIDTSLVVVEVPAPVASPETPQEKDVNTISMEKE